MKFLRLATIVVGFLALQLSLVGGGVACLVGSQGASTAVPGTSADVAMADMVMTLGGETQQTAAHTPSPAPRPCDQPVPRSCQTPASCTTPFVAVVLERAPTGIPVSSVPVFSLLAPSSLVLPPELPPPRA